MLARHCIDLVTRHSTMPNGMGEYHCMEAHDTTWLLCIPHIHIIIMEYGSTPYVGWHGDYEPFQSFSSVFISNKTVSVARDHRWSTTPASR